MGPLLHLRTAKLNTSTFLPEAEASIPELKFAGAKHCVKILLDESVPRVLKLRLPKLNISTGRLQVRRRRFFHR